MKVVRTIAEMRAARPRRASSASCRRWARCTPGTCRCFDAARAECDTVVATIFVNRAQFAPTEDFARYPRDEEQDARTAADAGVDILFVPEHDELYPRGFQTWVDVEELSKPLEGAFRPGHFRGVATVCLKLFNIVRPRVAYFGQKDAQQAAVLRRMVRDLNLELELRVLPTVRDAGRARALLTQRLSRPRRARARARAAARARDARSRAARASCSRPSPDCRPTTSTCSTTTARASSPPPSASAPPA